jgi:flagellar FliJ protein
MAKRFQFSLQTLLRVRELREREAQRTLGEAQAAVAQVTNAIAQYWREIQATQQRLTEAQRGERIDPQELSQGRAWVMHLRRLIQENEGQKAVLEQRAGELRDQWLEARKQVRVLEKLRERRWDAHRAQLRKEEQATMDEVAQRLHTFGPTVLGPLHDVNGND